MKKLNAVNLKDSLWETLNKVTKGEIDPAEADSVAGQAREILRTVKVQVSILDRMKADTTKDLQEFAVARGQ